MKECLKPGVNGDMCRGSDSCFLQKALDLEPMSGQTPEDRRALRSFERGVMAESRGCLNWFEAIKELNMRVKQVPQPSL